MKGRDLCDLWWYSPWWEHVGQSKASLKTEFKVNAKKASDSSVEIVTVKKNTVTWLKFEMLQFWGEDVMANWKWSILKEKKVTTGS